MRLILFITRMNFPFKDTGPIQKFGAQEEKHAAGVSLSLRGIVARRRRRVRDRNCKNMVTKQRRIRGSFRLQRSRFSRSRHPRPEKCAARKSPSVRVDAIEKDRTTAASDVKGGASVSLSDNAAEIALSESAYL